MGWKSQLASGQTTPSQHGPVWRRFIGMTEMGAEEEGERGRRRRGGGDKLKWSEKELERIRMGSLR